MVTNRQPHPDLTYDEQVAIARATLDRQVAEVEAEVDSTLVVAHLLTAFHTPFPGASARADRFFRGLRTDRAVGFITSTTWVEVSHFVISRELQRAVPHHQGDLTKALPRKRRFDWRDLYKIRPDLISQILPELGRLRWAMRMSRLTFLQPYSLGPVHRAN